MQVKVCYKNEIHRLGKSPKDFAALLQSLKEIFNDEIAPKFTLQYEDSDGDKIILANNEDYQLALDTDLSKTLKIYLIEVEDASNSSFISKSMFEKLEQSSMIASSKSEEKAEKLSKKISQEPIMEQKSVQATFEEYDHKGRKHMNKFWKRRGEVEYTNIPCECKGGVKASGKPCRNCFGTGLLTKKEAKKREKLQNLIKDAINQELPKLVKEIKQMIENPEESKRPVEESQKKVEEPKLNKPIHYKVRCDICGVCPIVGVRYKCTVMEDYDLCENCEAVADHPYPLLKIKNDSQHPIQVITVLNEHAYPEQPRKDVQQTLPRHSEEIQGLLNNLMSRVADNNAQVPKSTQEQNTQTVQTQTVKKEEEETPGQTNEETPGESKDETPQGNEYDATFVREINTIPEKIDVKDLTVYKTVSLRNNGLSAWPKNCYIESEGEISGEGCKLPSIEAGKDFSTVLIIKSPGKGGQFQSQWRFGYVDESGNKKNFGKSFTVEFTIAEDKPEKNLFAEVKKEEKKQYPSEVVEKAKAILDIFPQVKYEEVCEYIEQDVEKSIDELVQDYMSLLE